MGAIWEIKKDKEGCLKWRASGKRGTGGGEPLHFENGFDSNLKFEIRLFRNSINLTEFESNLFSKCSGSPPPVPLFPTSPPLKTPLFIFLYIPCCSHVPCAACMWSPTRPMRALCVRTSASECVRSLNWNS